MKATVWQGVNRLSVEEVPDPTILNDRDCIVEITSTAICGSDLHLYDGYMPTMEKGDILGHEFMGRVVEVGPGAASKLSVGDRVVVPFPIACGACNACVRGLYSVCENSNPNAGMAEKLMGFSPAGIFGYSHLTGGYAGGQAEYARVPFADVGPIKIEDDTLTDDDVLFLSDILPTGFMGAEVCDIQPHDVVAVWGAGPVGLLAAESARYLGAHRIIVIDRFDYRLEMARAKGWETIDYETTDVHQALIDMTGGRGPDKCIDAVGLEAHHGAPLINAWEKGRQLARMTTERGHALRQAITSCRNGGTVSIIGVYGGLMDKFPIGSIMNRSLTVKAGQAHVQRYMRPLLDAIQRREIDATFVITHHLPLEEAVHGYEIFKNKKDACEKVILRTPAAA